MMNLTDCAHTVTKSKLEYQQIARARWVIKGSTVKIKEAKVAGRRLTSIT